VTMPKDLATLLRTDDLWTALDAPGRVGTVGEVAHLVWSETESAEARLDDVLTGPPAWWPQRLRKTHGAYTVGVVRALLQRMPAAATRRPEEALQLTAMAITVAEAIDPDDYPRGMVARARAQALRDHAAVLQFMHRFADALDYVERAERAFEHVPFADYERARAALVKAGALRMQNRENEAIALTRDAARAFLHFDDRGRYLTAKIIESALLHDSARFEEALAVSRSIEREASFHPTLRASVTHNIGVCLCELGRRSDAIAPLQESLAAFERLGMTTEATRARWYLGNALLSGDRQREAILLLRRAWHEFAEAHLAVDGALAALDLADALIVNGEVEHVPTICREVIRLLSDAGLAARALPALALLREAAEMGRASRAQVRLTHDAVKLEARRETRVFAPAPRGEV